VYFGKATFSITNLLHSYSRQCGPFRVVAGEHLGFQNLNEIFARRNKHLVTPQEIVAEPIGSVPDNIVHQFHPDTQVLFFANNIDTSKMLWILLDFLSSGPDLRYFTGMFRLKSQIRLQILPKLFGKTMERLRAIYCAPGPRKMMHPEAGYISAP